MLTFLVVIILANSADVKLYNTYDTLLVDKLLIVTKSGRIYNYDLKYEQIRWHVDLGISLQQHAQSNGTHYLQPHHNLHFLVYDYGQFYKVTSEEIDLMFKQCDCFQNQVSYDSSLIYFLDIASGNIKQLTQYDLTQLLSQPKFYEKGVIINVDQKYILDLEFEDSNQHSSRIQINFLLKYLRGERNIRLHTTNITKTSYGLQIDWNNKTLNLHTNDEVFEVFSYDVKEGIYSNLFMEQESGLVLYSLCNQPGQCGQPLPTTEVSPFAQCLNKIYDLKKEQQNQNQIIVYEAQKCDIPETPQDNQIIIYIFTFFLCLLFTIGFTRKPKIITQTKEIIIEKQTVEIKKQYEIKINEQEIIGRGPNQSVVYRGTLLGKEIIVKKMKMQEFNYQNLNNENLVKILWHENDGNYLTLAIERCELNLKELVDLDQNKTMPEQRKQFYKELYQKQQFRISFLLDLLHTLQFLHEQGLMHGNIKPENVLFTKEGVPKLSELALQMNIKQNGDCMAIQRQNNIKDDVYSLGCVFYFFLSKGQYPTSKQKQKIQINSEAGDIIQKMISIERQFPKEYYNHPYFWSKQKKLVFLCEFSDYIETFDPSGCHSEKLQILSKQIYKDNDWGMKAGLILKYSMRKYDTTQCKQLVRLIRNVRNHYHELKEECKILLGTTDETCYDYWSTYFPTLFWILFQYSQEEKWPLLSFQ